jgi:hypothetical protein
MRGAALRADCAGVHKTAADGDRMGEDEEQAYRHEGNDSLPDASEVEDQEHHDAGDTSELGSAELAGHEVAAAYFIATPLNRLKSRNARTIEEIST